MVNFIHPKNEKSTVTQMLQFALSGNNNTFPIVRGIQHMHILSGYNVAIISHKFKLDRRGRGELYINNGMTGTLHVIYLKILFLVFVVLHYYEMNL